MTNTQMRNIPDNLPEIEFVDANTESLVNKLIAGYEDAAGRTLYPADPIRAFILWMADIIVQERVRINESAKQNLPRYAEGKNLDSLSEIFHNTYRLQEKAACTTLAFCISTELQQDYIITAGLEATVDGFINFATTENLVFKAGEKYAEAKAVCTTAGTSGNGFVPGQVNKLVSDEFLYFESVSNTVETAGGSEEENDTSFYNRMRESEESYTTAGSRGSYIYHAKSVSAEISDVSVESPSPGEVDVRILLYGGKLPDESLLDEVHKHLSADWIRPLTDKVIVAAPSTVPFDIEAVYYISGEEAAGTKEIQEAVEAAKEEYILWQTSKMGRDINPSYFHAVFMASGIKRAEIIKPEFMKVPKGSVPTVRGCSISFGGVEDE